MGGQGRSLCTSGSQSGISNYSGTVGVVNSTFSGNSAESGGAISAFGGVTLQGTVMADSPFGGNCSGPPTDGGHNVSDDGTCGLTQATGSLSNTNPLLDPEGLQDNGGPTQTIALQPESPAVDLVAEDACPPPETDQRGVQRPQGAACDSGAFELEQQAEPKTKADCKRGGWREFGFNNQGQCVASLQSSVKAIRQSSMGSTSKGRASW